MNVDDFAFELPEELIAAYPAPVRDESRLFVLPGAGDFEHRQFKEILDYLHPGDVLVMNDSRVIPARLFARRPTGGEVEVLLAERACDWSPAQPRWLALVRPAKKLKPGEELVIEGSDVRLRIEGATESGERLIGFNVDEAGVSRLLESHGQMPLPPYILKRRASGQPGGSRAALHSDADRERYQTVYSREAGSVAAPTAGLHFTPELLGTLAARGVQTEYVTLHVGLGTFKGMEPGTLVEDHRMHFEEYEVAQATAARITESKRAGRRIIAVGTTAARTLESAWSRGEGLLREGRGRTDLMIRPGYEFGVVDAMVTNFHLPHSTLLLLVSALIGRGRLLDAYREAIGRRYRFFSYGDAMFINPEVGRRGSR